MAQVFEFIKILSLNCIIATAVLPAYGKVDPPNYNFSLDELTPLLPGALLANLDQKFKNPELILNNGLFKTYRIFVSQLRYKFPVLIQTYEGKIVDFHARLPTYFLHDIFHQSLINRLGKQDIYVKKEEQATYIWKNKDGLKHVYSGACSITCFPIFYSVIQQNIETPGFQPILETLRYSEKVLQYKED